MWVVVVVDVCMGFGVELYHGLLSVMFDVHDRDGDMFIIDVDDVEGVAKSCSCSGA